MQAGLHDICICQAYLSIYTSPPPFFVQLLSNFPFGRCLPSLRPLPQGTYGINFILAESRNLIGGKRTKMGLGMEGKGMTLGEQYYANFDGGNQGVEEIE